MGNDCQINKKGECAREASLGCSRCPDELPETLEVKATMYVPGDCVGPLTEMPIYMGIPREVVGEVISVSEVEPEGMVEATIKITNPTAIAVLKEAPHTSVSIHDGWVEVS